MTSYMSLRLLRRVSSCFLWVAASACGAWPGSDSQGDHAPRVVPDGSRGPGERAYQEVPLVPVLGEGFGRLMSIEAQVVDNYEKDGFGHRLLIVSRVNGVLLRDVVKISWTYGGWLADTPEASGKDGFQVCVGDTYRLSGYEAGGWAGRPDLGDAFMSEWGPPQVPVFYFRSVFRVLDGELVRSSNR
jgi:hypothetical protein